MTPLLDRVRRAYAERFGGRPQALVRAPGRVNLIGEHTDYNDGFVLPMAIDREVAIALTPRDDGRVVCHGLDVGKDASFDLAALERGAGWPEYLKGVAWSLAEEGLDLRGWQGVMSGNVPNGAGLSSSAALELATARAFAAASDLAWDATRMALACQRAENRWVGVNSGIMDQLISARGEAGRALLIDCRTLEARSAPLPEGHAIVVLDTATRRGLVGSAYNERRAQCEEAARHFGVPALRDVGPEQLGRDAAALAPEVLKRARHVIGENARTLAAHAAMERGDAAELGRLMNASHESLRVDFEVSSPALDAIAACARERPGCRGARMTGAGFGGCAVALVEERAVEDFERAVRACYRRSAGRHAQVYVCRPVDGASRVG